MSPSLSASDLFNVKDLVAVVTGGATGIGLMIAKALEENGAKVYIIGRRKDVLERVAKKEAKFSNLIPIAGDVTSKADLEKVTNRISSEVGYINLLVANAGTTGPMFGDNISICGPDQSPLSEVQRDLWNIDPDLFLNTFATNIGGPFWSIVAFLPLLDAGNKKGNVLQSSQVVTTGSEAAYDRIPIPHYTYSASKAGLTHMMKQFATTFTRYKIRFNVIAPGRKPPSSVLFSDTRIMSNAAAVYPSELTAGFIASTENLSDDEKSSVVSPLQRPGNMEDMAGVIIWLASRAGAWVHGNVVLTDGGKISSVPATY